MAINFPNEPTINETFTQGDTTWQWDGFAWNIKENFVGKDVYVSFAGDTGSTAADRIDDALTIRGGTNITTTVEDDVLTIDFSGQVGATQNLFETVASDDGSAVASSTTDTLSILGGTSISTEVATDTKNLTINLDPFSINYLSDVDTTSTTPQTGNVLKWDGAKWAPGVDATTGGAGTDADTLDGFDSSYFLNYNNLNNKPTILTLDALSIGNERTAAGNGAIEYDDTTGVFRYTPPVIPDDLLDLGISDGTSGQVLTTDGEGGFTFTTVTGTDQNLFSTIDGDTGSTTANSTTDTLTIAGGTGVSTAIVGDTLTITNDSPNVDQNVFTTVNGDTGSAAASSTSDTLTIAGGTDISTTFSGNTLTIAYTGESGGGGATQNLFETINADSGTTTANTATDTLTVSGGSNISTSISGDTLTIAFSGSTGASAFTGLSDVSTAGLNVAQVYEPAITMFRVDNNGSSAYTFAPHYSIDNPTIYVISGLTVAFDLTAIGGHPFEIQNSTGNAYNVGLVHVANDGTVSTGANAQGKDSGVLYWRIPETTTSAPNYRYQCQLHSAMVGAITIKDLSAI